VSITPGEMALTRMGASSRARERARASAAPLVIATPRVPTVILAAATPENSTNDPLEGMRGATCLASSSGPITLVSNDRLIASRSRSARRPRAPEEAVETTWPTAPSGLPRAAMEASSVRSTVSVVIWGSPA
jgi:hypothetical protein